MVCDRIGRLVDAKVKLDDLPRPALSSHLYNMPLVDMATLARADSTGHLCMSNV